MSQANRIRQFALETIVKPHRVRQLPEATIRAGDIHGRMGLSNALPAVCSAIGSRKFEQLAGVRLIKREGPSNGANVYFTFRIDAGQHPETSAAIAPATRPERAATGPQSTGLNFNGAIALVSCVKSKRPHAAPARDLYTSPWFTKARDLVEASGAPWFVLSSFYGLVEPAREIEPYDYTLNTLGVAKRREWAGCVLKQLAPKLGDRTRVVLLAGYRYREFLVGPLQEMGVTVDVPMQNLRRGEQLAWLADLK